MRRDKRGVEWKEILTLSADDFPRLKYSLLCPAVQLTVAFFGSDFRFSHTLGIMKEGSFRPAQHLHHRNINNYRFLMGIAGVAVETVQRMGIVSFLAQRELNQKALRRTLVKVVEAEVGGLREEALVSSRVPKRGSSGRPGWGASIGEIVAQGGQKKGEG